MVSNSVVLEGRRLAMSPCNAVPSATPDVHREGMFRNTYQSGFLSILYSIG